MGEPAAVMSDQIRGQCLIHRCQPGPGGPQPSPAPLPFSAPLLQGLATWVLVGGKAGWRCRGSWGVNTPAHPDCIRATRSPSTAPAARHRGRRQHDRCSSRASPLRRAGSSVTCCILPGQLQRLGDLRAHRRLSGVSEGFIGSGWAFPVRADTAGRIALVSGEQDIEESIRLILATAPGERPMRPEFGCGIQDWCSRRQCRDDGPHCPRGPPVPRPLGATDRRARRRCRSGTGDAFAVVGRDLTTSVRTPTTHATSSFRTTSYPERSRAAGRPHRCAGS